MTKPVRSLTAEHLEAMNAALRSQQCQAMADPSIKKRVGVFEEAMLLITRLPLWTRCDLDADTVMYFTGRYLAVLLTSRLASSCKRNYQIIRSLSEAFQAVNANRYEWKSDDDFHAHLDDFFNTFWECVEKEPSWIGDDGEFEHGEPVLQLMRHNNPSFINKVTVNPTFNLEQSK